MSLVKIWDIACLFSFPRKLLSPGASSRGEEATSKGFGVDEADRRAEVGREKRDAGLDRVAARSASSIDLFPGPKIRHRMVWENLQTKDKTLPTSPGAILQDTPITAHSL
jgi:hypothetical protein